MRINNKKSLIEKKEILGTGFLFYMGMVFLLLYSCLLFSCCSAGEQGSFRYRGMIRKIDKFFAGVHDKNNFNGCVQIFHNGAVIFNKSYGYSNREFGIPNIPETSFMIGSITKQMTA
ncbi:MAG: serine hydrolase, partial [Spirochaetales bacterium]|nr:serine hydrolase [Spirochaetales bacterium]